jgi:hypothetical protein
MEHFQCSVLEMLKDKIVFAPKYHSQTKCLLYNVHVVVLCNEAPNMAAMSDDRYAVTTITGAAT